MNVFCPDTFKLSIDKAFDRLYSKLTNREKGIADMITRTIKTNPKAPYDQELSKKLQYLDLLTGLLEIEPNDLNNKTILREGIERNIFIENEEELNELMYNAIEFLFWGLLDPIFSRSATIDCKLPHNPRKITENQANYCPACNKTFCKIHKMKNCPICEDKNALL